MKLAHTLSLFVVALAFLAIITGAYITSFDAVAHQAQAVADPNERAHLVFGSMLMLFSIVLASPNYIAHRVLGGVLTLLAIGLAICIPSKERFVRVLGWPGVGMLALIVVTGWQGVELSPALGVSHALLAHLFFAAAVVTAVMTSEHWNRPPELADVRRPFLRPLAAATPPVIFAQITLGALYRHNVIGIMLHVAVAMAVALLALILSSVVLQNYPRPVSLRRSAATLIAAVLVQVSLGIVSLVMLLLNFSVTGYFIAATVAHVAIGAATLAASAVMALEVWRSVPR